MIKINHIGHQLNDTKNFARYLKKILIINCLWPVQIDLKRFSRNGGKVRKMNVLNILATFIQKKYKSLPPNSKVGHTLQNCKGCLDISFLEMQSRFPVNIKAINHSKAAKDNTFKAARMGISAKGNNIKECTRRIYNVVNEPFEKTFGVSFAEGLTGMKEIKIVKKPSAYEKEERKKKNNYPSEKKHGT